ncbi:MAG: hypothetical protein OHK0031_13600 [Anaerolineales bacterium]
MNRITSAAFAVIAITAGVLVLLGYFIDVPAITNFRILLLDWAVILAGVAALVGVGNLFSVHLQRVRQHVKGSPYSLLLLVALLIALFFGVTPGLENAQHIMLNAVMIPIEISLMALLAVSLVYAAIRLLRARPGPYAILFIVTVLLTLLGTGAWPFLGQISALADLRAIVAQVLAAGGARGILIGVALGTLTTGLRILLGADRPYGGK